MVTVWQAGIEFVLDESGDLIAKVFTRAGKTGDPAPYVIHYEGHFLEPAIGSLRRMAREAMKKAREAKSGHNHALPGRLPNSCPACAREAKG